MSLIGAVFSLAIAPEALATLVVINILMAWSLWFPMAANQLTMGSPAAIGMGAYISGYAALHWTSSLWIGMFIGLGVGLAVGLPIGALALRAREFVLAIMTLSIVLGLTVIETNVSFFGGAFGMVGVPTSGAVLGAGLIVLAVVLLFSWRVCRSAFGRQMDAVGHDELVAAAVGIRIGRLKFVVIALGSSVGGVAGVLSGRYTGYIDPTQFSMSLVTSLFAYVVLGGVGSFWGPVAGAAFLTIALQVLSFAGGARNLVFGGVIVAVMLLSPEGVVRRSRRLRARRFTASVVDAVGAQDQTMTTVQDVTAQ